MNDIVKKLHPLERKVLPFVNEKISSVKSIIEKYIKTGFKFIIICGGGKLARDMQQAASKLADIDNEALDWLGIYATRLNAQLIKTIFKNMAIQPQPLFRLHFQRRGSKGKLKKTILCV